MTAAEGRGRSGDHVKPVTLAECKCAATGSCKVVVVKLFGVSTKKVPFLSLSNFPSAVQEKKSLQDTETREEPANGQSGGKTHRDTLIRGEPKYSDAKACEGFK